MAVHAHSTIVPARPRLTARKQRQLLEAALERLLSVAETILADLDDLDGDSDLEPACEDEGAQCDDEGMCGFADPDTEMEPDREPEAGDLCNWQDEGDQTVLRQLPLTRRPARARQNTIAGLFRSAVAL